MDSAPDFAHRFLDQINAGQASAVIPELRILLQQQPGHPTLLTLLAEACRLAGRVEEAVVAYRQAGEAGAGSRNWLAAGVLLAERRRTDDALACLKRGLDETPTSDEILDALITTCFNAGRFASALDYARRQLTLSAKPAFLSNAALLLQSNELYEESSLAFKEILGRHGDIPAILGAALVPARFTCEWSWIESLQARISAVYARGDFDGPCEYPLTHVTWCTNETTNLAVTQAYRKRMIPDGIRLTPHPPEYSGARRLRVGYLSCDFRNHATMHLMASLFEHHDRERFEVFAYDYSAPETSAYRQRFLDAVEHHIDVLGLTDQQAAERIATDQLDILFDLKGYTGGARPGILAWRPAALQATYLGYPGSCASPDIDYIVSDRQVTPDASLAGYSERLCRLPDSYQCNDPRREIGSAGNRQAHDLPEDKVVFACFNQSYKIDRESFAIWLSILARTPDSVLWLLDQCPAAQRNLFAIAQAAGIDSSRLIFAPFAPPQAHLARLQLADIVLDTLCCNGHTTTSDALWAGIPVVTCRGRHFASRVSASLLHAIELPELIGEHPAAMADIAVRLATDDGYRAEIRQRLGDARLNTPLFDIARFTRNFERAIEIMVAAGPHATTRCLDVPDSDGGQPAALFSTATELRHPVTSCPLCGAPGTDLGTADCRAHPLWHPPLPPALDWMRCTACQHVYTKYIWSSAGIAHVFRNTNPGQLADAAANHDALRGQWSPVVERVTRLLGGYPQLLAPELTPLWLDVGCGDGGLLMTAADYGYAVSGLDARQETANRLGALGYAVTADNFLFGQLTCKPQVLSLMDVLEHFASPRAALHRSWQLLAPGGLLVISLPDSEASSWKLLEQTGNNPYWMEIEHYHNFSRRRLILLLQETGFDIVDFAIPLRYRAQLEIYARRVG